jgi:nicotinate-nucleotide pyrophosphorylase (carboxylating)
MSAFSPVVLDALIHAGLDPADVERVVRTALAEDLRLGPDVTTEATVPAEARATAQVVARAAGVVAGVPVALGVVDMAAGGELAADVVLGDGERVAPSQTVLRITGPLRAMLTAERTLLNLLTHLSGIATLTRSWVDEVAGTGAVIRDTRKTLPGLRQLQKYAVRCGGGANHRMGLGDAALIKDNHIAAAGGIAAAVRAVRTHAPAATLEVECDTLDQVREAVAAHVELLLLDNMTTQQMTEAVALARAVRGVRTEASGGLCVDRANEVAQTGLDFLAIGALTHSAPVLDLGLDLHPAD